MSNVYQVELDHIAASLAKLDLDSILCVMVNSLALHRGTSRHALLNRLKVIMISAAHTFDDFDKCCVIDLLRDAADTYEHALMVASNDKALH